MDDGLSDLQKALYEDTVYSEIQKIWYKTTGWHDIPIHGVNENDGHTMKEQEVESLLFRNMRFINDIKKLRNKYSKYKWKTAELAGEDQKTTQDLKRQQFHSDVDIINKKIRYPGNWKQGIHRLVFIELNEDELFVIDANKHFRMRKHKTDNKEEHIDIQLYGDITVGELRKVLPKIRKLIETQDCVREINSSIRKKTSFDKNLLIYDMAKSGKKQKEIVQYLEDEKIQHNVGYSDISKYVELVRKQIADMYA